MSKLTKKLDEAHERWLKEHTVPTKAPDPISYRPTAEADEKLRELLAYYRIDFPTLNKQHVISKAIVELWKQIKEQESK